LAREGCDVAIGFNSNREAATSVVAEIRTMGPRAVAIGVDVTNIAAGERLVSETVTKLGRLDVLVSNAGCVEAASFVDTTPEAYDRQQQTNTRGAFFVAQTAAKRMIAQGEGGKIVFITSRAAQRGLRDLSAYCVSKAGLKILTEVLAIELATFGINVNAVAPGTTETDINRAMLRDPAIREVLIGRILFGRPAMPRDIAEAVVFLSSDRAEFITGVTIAVDGGAAIN
jgi:glucose 1-dehydrogenase